MKINEDLTFCDAIRVVRNRKDYWFFPQHVDYAWRVIRRKLLEAGETVLCTLLGVAIAVILIRICSVM